MAHLTYDTSISSSHQVVSDDTKIIAVSSQSNPISQSEWRHEKLAPSSTKIHDKFYQNRLSRFEIKLI